MSDLQDLLDTFHAQLADAKEQVDTLLKSIEMVSDELSELKDSNHKSRSRSRSPIAQRDRSRSGGGGDSTFRTQTTSPADPS